MPQHNIALRCSTLLYNALHDPTRQFYDTLHYCTTRQPPATQPTLRMRAPTTHKRDDAETIPTTCTGADRPARSRVRPPPGVPPLRARASVAAYALAWHRLALSAPASFKQFRHHFQFSSVRFKHLNLVEKFASDGIFARARVRPARVRHSARVAWHRVEPA